MGNTESAHLSLGKLIKVLGWVVLVAGLALILEHQVKLLREYGVGELLETMSPSNLAYYRGTAVVLAPGVALLTVGRWLAARSRRRRRRRRTYLTDFAVRC